MHCELIVPALFAAREAPRLPALELLLARGRAARDVPLSLESWLAHAFELPGGEMPAGAVTALAAHEEAGGAIGSFSWARADPVHLRIGRDGVSLISSAGFAISREEADALAAALNRHLGGEPAIVPYWPDRWCLRSTSDVAPVAPAPIDLAGRQMEVHLSRKPNAARWHALLNETQMVLHDHAVNQERERRGEPAVNSVWFWGGGRLPQAARGAWHSVSADDPLAVGLARLAGLRHRALPSSAADWLERAPEDGRHLVLLDALRGALPLGGPESHSERLLALEERWFAPLLEALRRGRVGMVTVRAPDAGASYETVRGDLRRFWRRPQPLAQYGPPNQHDVRSGRIDYR